MRRIWQATVYIEAPEGHPGDASYVEEAIREGVPYQDTDLLVLTIDLKEGSLTFFPKGKD